VRQAGAAIDAGHLVGDEAGAGEGRQPRQVDVHLVEVVMPGDVAGQHAGVGGAGGARDDRQAGAGKRLQPEFAQDDDVAVAAADEQDLAWAAGFGGGHGLQAGQFPGARSTSVAKAWPRARRVVRKEPARATKR